MCVIKLSNIIDSNADLPQAGTALFAIMTDYIGKSEHIVIDMSDVKSLPSLFLNVSLGKLIDERGKLYVKNKMMFTNISKTQAERIKEYFERYR